MVFPKLYQPEKSRQKYRRLFFFSSVAVGQFLERAKPWAKCCSINPALPEARAHVGLYTGEHESVVQGGLLRQREQEAEHAADRVERLQRVADRGGNAADGRVRAAVVGDDVRMQVDVVQTIPVHDAAHLAADTLRLVCVVKNAKRRQTTWENWREKKTRSSAIAEEPRMRRVS